MAGTQRCGKWEKTVNREALCMTAQALYTVFGIQMSLFQVWQSACLPALVTTGRAAGKVYEMMAHFQANKSTQGGAQR